MSFIQSFQNWYPKRITWGGGAPSLKWQYVGEREFAEPFYLDTLSRALSDREMDKLYKETPLSVLDTFAEQPVSNSPDGFIFHMSRCGSTLLANMLRCHPGHLVISEASPLDEILRCQFKDASITSSQREKWFKSMISIIGQQRLRRHKRYFIKFDCWHIAAIPFIRKLFPDTPCLFSYRLPAEVLASHHALEGNQMVPGLIDARWYTQEPAATQAMSHLEYGIWVMEQILEHALMAGKNAPMLLVNYSELPEGYEQRVAPYFNIPYEDINVAELSQVRVGHSKNIGERYSDDKQKKQLIAQNIYREAQLERVNALYSALESLRAEQCASV